MKKIIIGLLIAGQLGLNGFLLYREERHEAAFYQLFPAVVSIIQALSGDHSGTGM